MPRLSPHWPRLKTETKHETRRCIRPRKEKSGIFGMKLHIGVDSVFGLDHTLTTTSANIHDITVADQLLHGEESM
ncbi:transposase [Gynuella sp.]|uniref:transposase n=1 Tax=Gynuella sp. TaxID=2969146 RepID=UPI003D146CE5